MISSRTRPSLKLLLQKLTKRSGHQQASGIFNEWELPSTQLNDALDFAFADDQRPKQPLGPVGLYISYSFEWREMPNPSRSQLSTQFKSGNKIAVALGGRRAFILPVFKFSASDQNAEFTAKLRALEAAMPFTPKDEYYYRIEPKKSGDGEKLVKLHKAGKMWHEAFRPARC